MSATAEKVDLGGLAGDATRRLGELEEQRLRLAPESLVDAEVAAELGDVESEIRSCKEVLERVRLAGQERERREVEARQQAAQAEREKALKEARKLATERATAAVKVDEAARAYADALKHWDRLTSLQEAALRRAGRDGAASRPRRWAIESGLKVALREAQLPSGIIELGISMGDTALTTSQLHPLAEIDHGFGRSQLGGDA